MNLKFKNLRSFGSTMRLDSVNWLVELTETLGEREKKLLITSSSEEFCKNILVFKDDFTYYLFKPTHHLYSFESYNDLLKCLKDFYNIHINNRRQIISDTITQKRIMKDYSRHQMFSCMNFSFKNPDSSYLLDGVHNLSRYEQSVLDPEKFNIPYIKNCAPFRYKGYDWAITKDGGFWLVGFDQPPVDSYGEYSNELYTLYNELRNLAFETDRYVLYSAVNGILNPR